MFQKKVQGVLCNVMSSASEILVMTFAVLDQQTTYNGLVHEGQQYQNPRAITFGRQPKEGTSEQEGIQLRATKMLGVGALAL